MQGNFFYSCGTFFKVVVFFIVVIFFIVAILYLFIEVSQPTPGKWIFFYVCEKKNSYMSVPPRSRRLNFFYNGKEIEKLLSIFLFLGFKRFVTGRSRQMIFFYPRLVRNLSRVVPFHTTHTKQSGGRHISTTKQPWEIYMSSLYYHHILAAGKLWSIDSDKT